MTCCLVPLFVCITADLAAATAAAAEPEPANRVGITGVAGYNNVGEGLYFNFVPAVFRALGLGLEQGGIYTVKQCSESGAEMWTGSISVGRAYGPWYGRRETGYVAGQWTLNEYIVKPEDECGDVTKVDSEGLALEAKIAVLEEENAVLKAAAAATE